MICTKLCGRFFEQYDQVKINLTQNLPVEATRNWLENWDSPARKSFPEVLTAGRAEVPGRGGAPWNSWASSAISGSSKDLAGTRQTAGFWSLLFLLDQRRTNTPWKHSLGWSGQNIRLYTIFTLKRCIAFVKMVQPYPLTDQRMGRNEEKYEGKIRHFDLISIP